MNKTNIILSVVVIVAIISISVVVIFDDRLQNVDEESKVIELKDKIKFLEDALATKTLHYEWLSEIMDNVLENGEIPDIDRTKIIDKT